MNKKTSNWQDIQIILNYMLKQDSYLKYAELQTEKKGYK